MGVFHLFEIVQVVLNRKASQVYFSHYISVVRFSLAGSFIKYFVHLFDIIFAVFFSLNNPDLFFKTK